MEREYGQGERDDDRHLVLESVEFTHVENGDWALERAPYNNDRDDDVTAEDEEQDRKAWLFSCSAMLILRRP